MGAGSDRPAAGRERERVGLNVVRKREQPLTRTEIRMFSDAVDDVADDLANYLRTVERAEEGD